jgi:hypothetical protein
MKKRDYIWVVQRKFGNKWIGDMAVSYFKPICEKRKRVLERSFPGNIYRVWKYVAEPEKDFRSCASRNGRHVCGLKFRHKGDHKCRVDKKEWARNISQADINHYTNDIGL